MTWGVLGCPGGNQTDRQRLGPKIMYLLTSNMFLGELCIIFKMKRLLEIEHIQDMSETFAWVLKNWYLLLVPSFPARVRRIQLSIWCFNRPATRYRVLFKPTASCQKKIESRQVT